MVNTKRTVIPTSAIVVYALIIEFAQRVLTRIERIRYTEALQGPGMPMKVAKWTTPSLEKDERDICLAT